MKILYLILRLMLYLAFYALVYILFSGMLRKTVRDEIEQYEKEKEAGRTCETCKKKDKCPIYQKTHEHNLVVADCSGWEKG